MAANITGKKPMPYDDPDTSKALNRTLHWLSRMHFQYCDAQFDSLGISPGQVPILMELGRHGEMSQKDLADKVRVTPATISGTLKRLEKNGFIERKPMQDDMRVSLVSLSAEGKQLMEEARSIFHEADEIPLQGFSNEERAQLLAYFKRMANNMRDSIVQK